MQCPQCSGEMWDNRAKKTNPKAPDFKCKDASCGGVIWPPHTGRQGAVSQGMKAVADKANSLMDTNRLEALKVAVIYTKGTDLDPVKYADIFLNYLAGKEEEIITKEWIEEQFPPEE